MRRRMPAVRLLASLLVVDAPPAHAQDADTRQLARDIFAELIEINTVTATGDTLRVAEAVAQRLRGTGVREPILLMAHLDVVEALPEDWTVEPFTVLERDGYYYGRGTTDDKNLVAAWVANLILYKQAGFVPNRDLVLVLEADEENGDANALGIQSLIANHRDLLDAAFALNEGGNLLVRGSDPLSNSVQTSEKRYTIFRLDVRNVGGHSSVPARDNAIYRLAAGLTHVAAHEFPLELNETTRTWLERSAAPMPRRSNGSRCCRPTTRSCAPRAWRRCSTPATPRMRCRSSRRRRLTAASCRAALPTTCRPSSGRCSRIPRSS